MATRRMNEVWRRMALALVLCVLLIHSAVCEEQLISATTKDQTNQTNPTASTNINVTNAEATGTPQSPQNIPDATEQARSSQVTPGTTLAQQSTSKSSDGDSKTVSSTNSQTLGENPDMMTSPVLTVRCVPMESVIGRDVVMVELKSPSTCGNTAKKFESYNVSLCHNPPCTFEIFQEENSKNVIMTGKGIKDDIVQMKSKIDDLKDELGVETVGYEQRKSSPAIFISLLVTGLVAAAALIGGYLWKNNRPTNSKGMKLANESVMADEENQGNTLVSVAPLNPPEPQEKPSLNGESPEAVKTQNPPAATNGHSGTKTADTEL